MLNNESTSTKLQQQYPHIDDASVSPDTSNPDTFKCMIIFISPNPIIRIVGRSCKGNPLRFRRPLVFRFRFRLPPAFRFRSRHLVSLPQRLRMNDVLRHPSRPASAPDCMMSHDVTRLIVPTRHLFRPAFRL